MKKLFSIFIIILFGLSLSGCVKTVDCSKQFNPKDNSPAQMEQAYNYCTQCKINPSFDNHTYTSEAFQMAIATMDKFENGDLNSLPNKEQAYKDMVLKTFVLYFGEIADNIDLHEEQYQNDMEGFCQGYNWYLNEAKKLYDEQTLYAELDNLITYFDNAGYFNNPKFYWLFSERLSSFVMNDLETKKDSIYEPLTKRLDKYYLINSSFE